jgi:hypothetical protein
MGKPAHFRPREGLCQVRIQANVPLLGLIPVEVAGAEVRSEGPNVSSELLSVDSDVPIVKSDVAPRDSDTPMCEIWTPASEFECPSV